PYRARPVTLSSPSWRTGRVPMTRYFLDCSVTCSLRMATPTASFRAGMGWEGHSRLIPAVRFVCDVLGLTQDRHPGNDVGFVSNFPRRSVSKGKSQPAKWVRYQREGGGGRKAPPAAPKGLGQRDQLGDQVGVQTFGAAFRAVAAFLHAAEG